MKNPNPSTAVDALRRRLNALAYDLVNEELARLACVNEQLQAENDALRQQLAWAEDCAECWYEQAMTALNAAADAAGGAIGLTRAGRLSVVAAGALQ